MKILAWLLFATSTHAADLVSHASAHPDGRAVFSFDASAWQSTDETRRMPVGVFDSGIGGLTVLESLLTLDAFHNDTLQPGADGTPDFAQERFIYFGDQANMPYGNYPAVNRTDYLRELIVKDAIFLLGRRFWSAEGKEPQFTKPPVKAIVIACNTATAYGLEDIRKAVAAWKIPVIVVGVVEAGARGVLESQAEGGIGVLATSGTCASGVYPRTITQTLGLAGKSVPAIAQQGSPTLAGAIEGDSAFPESVSAYALKEARALAEAYRGTKAAAPLQTIVLGCTHYPLAKNEIDAAFDELRKDAALRDLIAEKRVFVNPAEATARELFRELAKAKLRLKADEHCSIEQHQFYFSVPRVDETGVQLSADGSLDKDYKYSRAPGHLDFEDTKNVPLTPDLIPANSAKLVRERLPAVWKSLNR
ncbi:MAG: aspartate/glutamate racemase family protein [Verrucomicrobiaceae bacterium]|nr:aspartate/glutamate racemase family protein [Verrucomicrobiaceae bacterium]